MPKDFVSSLWCTSHELGVPRLTGREENMENSTDILTIAEVAKLLRCSKAHVQNALRGKLHGVPRLMHLAMGRRKVVRREWLQEWLETGKTQ
ncbi:MAG: helix-turn-helix domain-containing protein [Acidobacteriota bacterium]|nr:helix-turn-helix domain-containing protein [Acidobacteriota bacterium]